ncbi:MAG: hypothetical protein P8Y95_01110 [Gammaproteobacteria bacterium]
MRGPVVVSLALVGVFVAAGLWSFNLTAPRVIGTAESVECVLVLAATGMMSFFFVHTMHAIAHARTMVTRLKLSTRLQVALGTFGSVCLLFQEEFGSGWSVLAVATMLLMALSAVLGRSIYRRTRGRQHRARRAWSPRAMAESVYGWLKAVYLAGEVRRRMAQNGNDSRRRSQLFRFPRHGLDPILFNLWRALHAITLAFVIMSSLSHAYAVHTAPMT